MIKQVKRSYKKLKSPVKTRRPLRERNGQEANAVGSGKRKMLVFDEEMEDVHQNEPVGKKAKSLELFGYTGLSEVEMGAVVEAMHKAGGMAVFWKEETQVLEVNLTAFTIEVRLEDDDKHCDWWFIGVYASCDGQIRKEQWRVLRDRSRLWGDRYMIVVEQAWQKDEPGSRMFKITRKIRNCRIELLKWRNTFQANSKRKIVEVRKRLEAVSSSEAASKKEMMTELKNQLKEAYQEEEKFWNQKARLDWLREGDKNTKYFHAFVKGRRIKNRIRKLQRENGSWAESEEEIVSEISGFFRELFTSGGRNDMSEILEGIPHSITQEMNTNLTKPVEEEEIQSAIFSMQSDKAPGQDGMSPLFFQRFWSIIKGDLIPAIQAFFSSGFMLKSINHIVISLIPKTLHPTCLKNFRPISLCNVIYKTISKILANRMKLVLGKCISNTQSAFIPDRQILDNVILVHEYMHYLKNKRQGKEGFMAIKLDMAKAYDRVEWHFLQAMMQKMGFCARWINWITSCLSSVSYSFNCNGESKGFVTPERGIRQGDPLSPYLFLICSEGFSNLLKKAEERKDINGLRISRQGPLITHLFFADDSLIFCKANNRQATEVMKILRTYEKASGQLINLDKSAIFFSKNVSRELRREVCSSLGGMAEMKQGKYLGLPMVIARTKDQIFGFIKENIRRKLQDWRNKFLSNAGKEVLLKAVSMAMPTYAMSVFKLPRKMCKDIRSMMANYWWGETNGKNKMHWVSWRKMSMKRNEGGLGFKDIEAYNKALLGKQIWRIITKPNLLVSKVLKARYFPKDSILSCKTHRNALWFWQGLLGARCLIDKGMIRRIGNGRSTSIWDHRWIPGSSSGKPTTPRPLNSDCKMVHELINQQRWNRNTIFKYFNHKDAEKILNIPLSLTGREDSYYWQHNAGGNYTVSSGYQFLMKERSEAEKEQVEAVGSSIREGSQQAKQMWKTLWKLNIKHKIKIFIWKCITGALPVRAEIYRKTRLGDPVRRMCREEQESVEHLFFSCPHTQEVWKAAPIKWDGVVDQQGSFKRWWITVSEARRRPRGKEHIGLTANILWQVWKERNKKEFENKGSCLPARTISKAHKEWLEQEESLSRITRPSTGETTPNNEEPIQGLEEAETIVMEVATESQFGKVSLGIGVRVRRHPNTLMAEWALRERTLEQRWSRIAIHFQNQELMRQISNRSPSNSSLATLIEDILNMQGMFRMCLFSSVRDERIERSKSLSHHAFGIIVDEEWIVPQCY
nr:uncharacterized protein LOC113708252 [Coffea arabica]